MKYWAYLNDGVSQKPYTEDELQKLDGFGPDTLVCSETSAVSQEPDWKPAKEFFPYLVRPKAPDFSKFRPKPPMPAVQNHADTLPVPETLPAGVNAMPLNEQKAPAQDVNSDLLAQIKSLTDKIASLEGKIAEQEKELKLSESIPQPDEELEEATETFVSEPQNEQEDDVLEVPFENDFEVPFDTNKSSEEIAKEAEAMLSKPVATEIEEYNTDDQSTELLDYASDMQKILEDTIRKSHLQQPNEKKTDGKDKKKKTRTFIAEDLISNKTLSFSEKEEPENEEQKPVEQEPAEQEDEEMSAPKNTSFKDPAQEENQENVEEISDDGKVQSLDELLQESAPENKQEDSVNSAEQQPAEENKPEVNAEEPSQEETPAQVQEEIQTENQEEKQEESQEETPATAQLADIDAVSNVKTKEPAQEETPAPAQLAAIDAVSNVKTKEPAQEETPAPAQLASLDAVSNVETKEPAREEAPAQVQLASLDPVSDINIEKPEESEPLISETETPENNEENNPEELTPEELTPNNLDIDGQDEYLKTVSLDDDMDLEGNMTQQLKVAEEQKEDVQSEEPADQDKPKQEEVKTEENNTPEVNPNDEKVEISDQVYEDNHKEHTANLSMTQGVTISNDDTTAAVLDEIAQEKAQTTTGESTSSQLFKELENTYKGESANIGNSLVGNTDYSNEGEVKLDDNLNQEFTKEDEFLKTFTTSVEEVFLDQPTAIISDYVPPTATSEDINEHSRPALSDSSVKRAKPSDIKTVPLVPEAMGQEIWSSPYVESATAKLGKTSVLANLGKWIFLILAITLILAVALSALAVMGIIPEKLSPVHTVIYSLQKTPQENTNSSTDEDLTPEIAEDTSYATEETQPAGNDINTVVEKVKNYTFNNGAATLESKIKLAHPNLSGEIEWAAHATEEPNIYSIAVKVPQNAQGQGFSYRYNYNLEENILTPTTSGAKNIMDNY